MFHLIFRICLLCIPFSMISAEENFLLVNSKTDEIIMEKGPDINKRISPCSTFKIALSLMGFDAGIKKNETFPILDNSFDQSWKESCTPQSWMNHSTVWYSRMIAFWIGPKKMQEYVTDMQYGNEDLSGGLNQPFLGKLAWINSSLKISPKEQVDFITRMLFGVVPVSMHSIEMTKAILFKEELMNGWKLYGKTGWSGLNITKDGKPHEHAWFVGWVENENAFYPFAYLVCEEHAIDLEMRIPRVKELILESGILLR